MSALNANFALDHTDDGGSTPSSTVQAMLRMLTETGVIHPEDWRALPREAPDLLAASDSLQSLGANLVKLELLNAYQAARVQARTLHGLVLGNYRVLGRIGAGAHSVVFEAEHSHMRRKVAVKVLPLNTVQEPDLIARFLREIRSVAVLDHPNIVAAIDAGVCTAFEAGGPDLYYFVMEHLSGQDLEQRVQTGPLAISDACALIYQLASALDAAHQKHLVHRDIKPSNVLITRDGNAKLLDFGLVRNLTGASLTTSSDLVGTLDYMAPEQARDPTSIDIRADIFGLGATLFFALIGQSPFPLDGSVHEMLRRRQVQPPLRAGALRPDVPRDLDDVLDRMMALRPDERFSTPQAVMHALLPFLDRGMSENAVGHDSTRCTDSSPARGPMSMARRPCVLVVDGDAWQRRTMTRLLMAHRFDCLEAESTDRAWHHLQNNGVQVVMISVDGDGIDGRTLLQALRDNPPCANLKVLMTSTRMAPDELSAYLAHSADDCLALPVSDVQLIARVQAAVQHKESQDHLDRLNQQLMELNGELERSLTARTSDLTQARNSLVLALARLVEYRSTETIAHLSRIQRYCVALAQEASTHPRLAGQIDQDFLQTLECVAPLHDIGNAGLPDAILLKAGPLTPEERSCMQTHTEIGAATLQHVAHEYGAGAGFLHMAIDVARHHHEHHEGAGYPDGLAGDEIPLAARIVAIADTYDSLRSRRAQRPRLAHGSAVEIILNASPGKFDPILLNAFQTCAPQMERIYSEIPDSITID